MKPQLSQGGGGPRRGDGYSYTRKAAYGAYPAINLPPCLPAIRRPMGRTHVGLTCSPDC